MKHTLSPSAACSSHLWSLCITNQFYLNASIVMGFPSLRK
uniref:Uncharacterized protein n=1 Tax=Anguilla anguilla TaxID=7936 RepID=A0A0E9PH83_ANGAN